MRRRIKRSSLFTMVALIALLSLGIGYAAWQDSLAFSGSVETGNLNVRWDNASTTDNEVGSDFDIGTCDASNATNSKVLEVDLSNAYPGYSCDVTALILNDGSVPAQITRNVFTDDGNPELNIDADCGSNNTIIDVGAANALTCTATILVEDSAAESSTYTASAEIDFTNYSP